MNHCRRQVESGSPITVGYRVDASHSDIDIAGQPVRPGLVPR